MLEIGRHCDGVNELCLWEEHGFWTVGGGKQYKLNYVPWETIHWKSNSPDLSM